MSGMRMYYLSRAAISIAFGALLLVTGSPWWVGTLVAVAAMVWFLAAPHLGRYVVHPERGVTALQRDERGQTVNNAAARNAFIASMLVIAAMIIWAGSQALTSIPIDVLKWVLIFGVLVYYASDFWLRQAQA